jgi:hypothetical protein
MDTSTIIMMAGAAIMLIAAYGKAPEAAQRGLNASGSPSRDGSPSWCGTSSASDPA